MSVRRIVLDPLLVRAAERAGAAVRMATKVTGLVKDGNRVVVARDVPQQPAQGGGRRCGRHFSAPAPPGGVLCGVGETGES